MSDNSYAKPGEINGDPFDRFTIGHAAIGIIFGLARVPWWVVIPFAIGWELVETPLKRRVPYLFPHASADTPANAIVDAIAMISGWAAMRVLPKGT
jgi:hypothetical protein